MKGRTEQLHPAEPGHRPVARAEKGASHKWQGLGSEDGLRALQEAGDRSKGSQF